MIYCNCGFVPIFPFAGISFGMGYTPTYRINYADSCFTSNYYASYPDTCYTQTYYTGQPDMGLWNMNPYRVSGNFGGRPQFSTYSEDYSYMDIMRARHAEDTSYYNNYFINSFVSTLNQNTYTAIQQQQINNEAYKVGTEIGTDVSLNSGIQATSNTIASVKNQLERDINNSQITKEQKEEFEALKKRAEDLEARIKQLIEDKKSGSKTPDQILAELKSINSENIDIITKREDLVKKINEARAAAAAEADKPSEEEKTEEEKTEENKPITDQENKTAQYKAQFSCKIGTTCSGVACAVFVDKRGETHYAIVRTGSSWDDTNAKNDLIDRIQAVFKNAGFTNVKLYTSVKAGKDAHPEISDEDNLKAAYTAKGRFYREKLAGTGYGAVTFVDKKGNCQTFVARSGWSCKSSAGEILTDDLNNQIKAAGYTNVTLSVDTVNYWP